LAALEQRISNIEIALLRANLGFYFRVLLVCGILKSSEEEHMQRSGNFSASLIAAVSISFCFDTVTG
jgi:hypothetical protein